MTEDDHELVRAVGVQPEDLEGGPVGQHRQGRPVLVVRPEQVVQVPGRAAGQEVPVVPVEPEVAAQPEQQHRDRRHRGDDVGQPGQPDVRVTPGSVVVGGRPGPPTRPGRRRRGRCLQVEVGHMRPWATASSDPGDDLVEHDVERGRRGEAEHLLSLVDGRHAALHVVLERVVGDVAELLVAPDLLPDHLGQLEHRGAGGRRQVEVLVEGVGVVHGHDDAPGQVAAVGVVPHLRAVAEDVERILALEHLLHEVGHHVAHGQLHVAAEHLDVAERPLLADADAVERPQDRVGQLVLVPCGVREVLDRQLLEAVGRQRRGHLTLLTLERRPGVGRLEHHRGAQVGDLLEPTVAGRGDGGVARRGDDALVGGQQVVGVGVEVGDAADHRRAGDEVVAVHQQLGHERGVLHVRLDQPVVGVVVVAAGDLAVLRVVVDADDGVARLQQLLHDVAADEAGRAADQNRAHVSLLPKA